MIKDALTYMTSQDISSHHIALLDEKDHVTLNCIVISLRPRGRGRKLVRGWQGVRNGRGRMGGQRQLHAKGVYVIWCTVEDKAVQKEGACDFDTATFSTQFEVNSASNLVPLLFNTSLKCRIWYSYFFQTNLKHPICATFFAIHLALLLFQHKFEASNLVPVLLQYNFQTTTLIPTFSTEFEASTVGFI